MFLSTYLLPFLNIKHRAFPKDKIRHKNVEEYGRRQKKLYYKLYECLLIYINFIAVERVFQDKSNVLKQ